jgi:hypothetical protein
MITGVRAVGEIGGEQRPFQFQLLAREACPMQQPVGVEGVVDPGALEHVEAEPEFCTATADHFLALRELLDRGTVFLCDMLGNVLAARTHVGIEFEGLAMQVGLDVAAKMGQCREQRLQPDRTPRTGHIRNKVELHPGAHGNLP